MTAKHRDPLYIRNARIIRQQAAAKRRRGEDVECWRCGGIIDPEQRWDVGHRDPAAGHGLGNLAPEHRYKTSRCQGNRAAGGRLGAAMTNQRRRRTSGLLPWT